MKPAWRDKLSYGFDNFMAKGTVALIGGLWCCHWFYWQPD